MTQRIGEGGESPSEGACRRGRPLDPAREEAILGAVWELLEELGYDQMTVKDVATRAGAGLGAIYRRWPTKVELVISAIQAHREEFPRSTGDVETDLARLMTAEVERLGSNQCRVAGFVSAIRHNPALACAVRESLVLPVQRAYMDILSPTCDDAVECRLRGEMAMSLILHLTLLTKDPPTESQIRRYLVPLVLGRPLPRLTDGSPWADDATGQHGPVQQRASKDMIRS